MSHLPPTYQPYGKPVDLSIIVALWATEQEEFMRLQGLVMSLCTDKAGPVTEFVMVANGEHGAEIAKLNPEHVQRHLKIGRFDKNVGVAGAWNAGISLAEGRNLLILNEDAVPTKETILALYEALDEHPDWGVVGIEGHDLVWSGERPMANPDPGCFRAQRSYGAPRFEPVPADGQECMFVTGHCFALRRADIVEIGKFSEVYSPFWNEDTSVCFEMRRVLAKKAMVIPGVATHEVGISARQHPNRAIPFLGGAVPVESHKMWSNWQFHRRFHGEPGRVAT